MKRTGSDRPVYMISVAAELAGVHPQTLRIYERKQLICPQRSGGNTRLYSEADIERLKLINELTAEGINLAGVMRIMQMEREVEQMQADLVAMRNRMIAMERETMLEERARQVRTAIVRVEGGMPARRQQG